jgi:aspartate/methionine/tyrosine aminotransferase
MIAIAREYDLFVICDEVYLNIVYNGQSTKPLSDLIGDIPGMALRGISKEVPWPGARCGWAEIYNADRDPVFKRYVQSILNAKMVEVCSTTLPQKAIPRILEHPEYPKYLDERRARYENCSNTAYEILKDVPGIKVNRANGAFYMSVVIKTEMLNHRQTLPIENTEVRNLVERLVGQPGVSLDKRFVYYLLAATGICVVPLSSFCTRELGFRITLLERDEKEFTRIFHTIAESISAYLNSSTSG